MLYSTRAYEELALSAKQCIKNRLLCCTIRSSKDTMRRILFAAIIAATDSVDMSLATRRRFVGRATAAVTAAATTPAFAAKTYVSGMSRRHSSFASTPSKRERGEHGRHARRQEPRRPTRERRHEGNEEGWFVSAVPRRLRRPLRKSVRPGPAPADARRVPQPVPRRVLRYVRAMHVHDPRCVSKLSNDYTAMFTRRPIARHSFSEGMRGRRPPQDSHRAPSPARARPGQRFAGARRRPFLHP